MTRTFRFISRFASVKSMAALLLAFAALVLPACAPAGEEVDDGVVEEEGMMEDDDMMEEEMEDGEVEAE
ncbi:MAG: hypothetical protein AAFY26_19290 [Cyanobacteria bacterium J06638_22]